MTCALSSKRPTESARLIADFMVIGLDKEVRLPVGRTDRAKLLCAANLQAVCLWTRVQVVSGEEATYRQWVAPTPPHRRLDGDPSQITSEQTNPHFSVECELISKYQRYDNTGNTDVPEFPVNNSSGVSDEVDDLSKS